jgi:hypothetical protein
MWPRLRQRSPLRCGASWSLCSGCLQRSQDFRVQALYKSAVGLPPLGTASRIQKSWGVGAPHPPNPGLGSLNPHLLKPWFCRSTISYPRSPGSPGCIAPLHPSLVVAQGWCLQQFKSLSAVEYDNSRRTELCTTRLARLWQLMKSEYARAKCRGPINRTLPNKGLEPPRWPARLTAGVDMTSNVKSRQQLFLGLHAGFSLRASEEPEPVRTTGDPADIRGWATT